MNNFLFFDSLRGEYFFVQCGVMEETWDEACLVVDDEDELEYIGVYTDEEAEAMGYDTY